MAILGAVGLIALAGAAARRRCCRSSPRRRQPGRSAPPSRCRPTSATSRRKRRWQVNAQIPLAGGPNPAAAPFALGKASAETRARALECLTSAIYYEAGAGKRRRPARGRAGRAQPRPPSRPSPTASAAWSMKARPGSPAASSPSPATARWPARRSRRCGTAPARSPSEMLSGPRLCAGRLRDPLSRQLCRALLGLEPGQDQRRGRAHLLPLGRRLGPSGGLQRSLVGPRRQSRCASPRRAQRAACRAAGQDCRRDGREAGGSRRQGHRRTRTAGCACCSRPQAREAVEKVKVTPYVERVAASDNLRFALDGGSPGAIRRPFGRSQRPRPRPRRRNRRARARRTRAFHQYEEWRE